MGKGKASKISEGIMDDDKIVENEPIPVSDRDAAMAELDGIIAKFESENENTVTANQLAYAMKKCRNVLGLFLED